jgi:hypothetical protein
VVDRAREHAPELGRAHARLELGKLRRRLGDRGFVALGGAELDQDIGVLDVPRQLFDGSDLLLERRTLA